MKYIAEIEYVKENGSITSVSASGLTSVSGSAFGYTSNSPSSNDGTLSNVTLTISKSNNKVFRILFKDNYVTKYSINNEEFTNNKRELIIFNTSDTLTIKLLKLSEFGANYEILQIDTNIKIEYDNNSILDCTRGSQLKSDSTTPNYSPISQYGSLELKDLDDVIINLSTNNLLKEYNTKVNLYISEYNNPFKFTNYIDYKSASGVTINGNPNNQQLILNGTTNGIFSDEITRIKPITISSGETINIKVKSTNLNALDGVIIYLLNDSLNIFSSDALYINSIDGVASKTYSKDITLDKLNFYISSNKKFNNVNFSIEVYKNGEEDKINIKQQIGSYDFVSGIDYKFGEYKCNIELTDEISKYNDILIEPLPMYWNTYDNLYNILKSLTPNNEDFEVSNEAFERFSSIDSYFYSKKSESLFTLWSWFCNATKTTLYINEKGKKVFKVWL